MIHNGENYSVKLQKYFFCNGILLLIDYSMLSGQACADPERMEAQKGTKEK